MAIITSELWVKPTHNLLNNTTIIHLKRVYGLFLVTTRQQHKPYKFTATQLSQ